MSSNIERRSEARGEGFTRVIRVMERDGLSPSTRSVAAFMLLHTSPDGSAWHSVKRLAEEVGITEDTVKRAQHDLYRHGLLLAVMPRGKQRFRQPSGQRAGELLSYGQGFWCFPLAAGSKAAVYRWAEWVLKYTGATSKDLRGDTALWDCYIPAALRPQVFPGIAAAALNAAVENETDPSEGEALASGITP